MKDLRPDVNEQDHTEGLTLLVQLIKPKSEGKLTLKSTNPFEQPNVDPQYLENTEDVDSLVKGKPLFNLFVICVYFKGTGLLSNSLGK